MFRIVCDPSSGSIELYLTEIIRGGSLMFVVCLVGVWQHNWNPWCVCTVRRTENQLTHCGRVNQIFVFTLQLCKTDEANLRF